MSIALQHDITEHTALFVLGASDPDEVIEALDDWDKDVVRGADEAMEAMEDYDYSVVVSAVEGTAERVFPTLRERHPGTSRVLIADALRFGAKTPGLADAHHVILKPLEPATVEAVLDCATGGVGQVTTSRLKLTLGETTRLPTLSTSFVDLLRALDDPMVTAQQIAKVMRSDPAMVAKTLQMANSSFFRLPRKVSSLEQAVVYLGINSLRAATLAGRCFEAIPNVPAEYLERVRKNSLFATQMVREMGGPQVQDALTAAILQDIGQLLMLGQIDEYGELMDAAERGEGLLHELEQEHLGVTHAHIGATLLAIWGLPDAVVRAVAFSHTRFPVPSRGLDTVSLTYLSGALTLEANAERPLSELLPDAWLDSMGLSETIVGWREYTGELALLKAAA